MKTGNKVILWCLAAFFVAGIGYAIFDDSPNVPDADEQEKVLLKCLGDGGRLTTTSEIPPAGVGNRNPEYEITVREDGDAVAYLYLFDQSERADAWIDEVKLDADTEGETSTIKRRGTAAVDIDAGGETTGTIHRCVDKAQEPVEE